MPQGKGTYGSQVGRPAKKKKMNMGGYGTATRKMNVNKPKMNKGGMTRKK
tara:strand:+ start:434 stop:583 length:150 start_codon:yes stop_codon:yes gene_type:complete